MGRAKRSAAALGGLGPESVEYKTVAGARPKGLAQINLS